MPYTQYAQGWLEDNSAIRIIVVKIVPKYSANGVSYANSTLFFSNAPFITTDGSVVCNPVIRGDLTINESIEAGGGSSMSISDVEIDNSNGDFDNYLNPTNWIWSNCSVTIYYGDPTWTCADAADIATKFATVFNGVCDDIDSRTRKVLNFKIRDKMEKLNAPVTESKLGTYGYWASGQQNQDTIKPLVFGEVFNITPLLIDPSTLQYMVNDGPIEKIIEIRDNGVPIYTDTTLTSGAVIDTSTGTFKLTSPSSGQITCSVQGVKNSINMGTGALVAPATYTNKIANIIALIATQYGQATTRLTAGELDLTNLSAFDSANTQPVGIAITDTTNVITVCNQLAGSIGSQVRFTRLGLLQILQYGVGFTSGRTVTTITEEDILYGTLMVAYKTPIVASTKLGYCKNWTMQPNLVTNIPQAHKDTFDTEYLTVTITDSTVKTNYLLTSDATQKDTLLLVASDATTEATRLNDFNKVPRIRYKFTGTSKLLGLLLGQSVTLYHSRFNLSSGVVGQVVSLSPNWKTSYVDVEVLV